MENLKIFFKKVRKAERFASGNITPENSTIVEVLEYQQKLKEVEQYEHSIDSNKAA